MPINNVEIENVQRFNLWFPFWKYHTLILNRAKYSDPFKSSNKKEEGEFFFFKLQLEKN